MQFQFEGTFGSVALPSTPCVKIEFPNPIQHDGQTWWLTGKSGIQISTGLPTAEYSGSNDEKRVWMNANMTVYPE